MADIRARLNNMQMSLLQLRTIISTLDDIVKVNSSLKSDLSVVWSDSGYEAVVATLDTVNKQINNVHINANKCVASLKTAIASYAAVETQNTKDIATAITEFSLPTTL